MSERKLRSLCVYCGSRFGTDPRYQKAAEDLGRLTAEAGLRLVFGGGEQGLMGVVARAARDAGAPVLGIIPRFLQEKEGLLDNIESREVETMHERKIMMFDECEAFCALPGGIGTLEETIEVLSWASLAIHKKPIVLCNVDGYWDPLIDLIEHMVTGGFAYPGLQESMVVVDRPEDVIGAAEAHLERRLEMV
ncbi:MAG: TIGR00730 family Rossman fold protein [Parvularcula sp.]|nr:TIGR00730 family Rossman fold protein [Parvularcula sp.]